MTTDHFTKNTLRIVPQDGESAEGIDKDAVAVDMSCGEITQPGWMKGISEAGELFECGGPFLSELMMAARVIAAPMETYPTALGEEGEATNAGAQDE
jgi:methanogenic corrinoid protein MtbC1